MGLNPFKILKSLKIVKEGTLTPSTIEIFPAGTNGKTTTVTYSQTDDRTLTLPDETGTILSTTSIIDLDQLETLPVSKVAVTGVEGKLTTSNTNSSQLQYLDDVTGNLQGQLDNKAELDLSNILPVATINVNSQKITALGTPLNPTDAVTKAYADLFLKHDGTNTATANISMDTHQLKDLATPTDANDATTKAYVDDAVTGGGANRTLSNLDTPTAINENLIFDKGDAIVQTKDTTDAVSADITVKSGIATNSTSGDVNIKSGDSSGGSSGYLVLQTGSGVNGGGIQALSGGNDYSGNIDIASGNVTTESGKVTIRTGTGSISQNIELTTGSAATRGKILLDANYVDVNSKNITNVATPVNSTDAVNKAYVDAYQNKSVNAFIDSAITFSSESTIVFSGVEWTDFGSAYNAATGIFTAPVAGKYLITMNLTVQTASALTTSQYLSTYIFQNSVFNLIAEDMDKGTGALFRKNGNLTKVIKASVGDTIGIRAECSVSADVAQGSFGIVFLGA